MLVVLAVGFLLPAASLFAATQNGTVYGTVYDASGNPMQGVRITLENSALGFSRSTITAADGPYNFQQQQKRPTTTQTSRRHYDIKGASGSSRVAPLA